MNATTNKYVTLNKEARIQDKGDQVRDNCMGVKKQLDVKRCVDQRA